MPGIKSGPGVVCFGHPLLDMMADVDEDFLNEFGIESGSVNLATPEQDSLFTRLLERGGVEYTPGGASMNTARSMAWIRPYAHTYYVGALGKDKFAEILRSSLSKAGVRQLFEACDTKPTGTCAGLVYKKERSLLTKLGAAVELSLEHMYEDSVQNAIADAQLYYSEGFFLNTASSPDNLLSVALHAHRHNKIFTLNLSAPYISVTFHARLKVLMPHVDMLFGSDDDILAFAKVNWSKDFARLDTADASAQNDVNGKLSTERRELLIAALKRICALPTVTAGRPRLVVCTCGADNTYVASAGTVRSYEVPAMSSDEIVDVNGAGDAFVGGFLSQYLTYPDESLCAQVGHEAAQNCIRHNGAGFGGAPPVLRSLGVSEMCSDGVAVLVTSPKAVVAAN